MKTKKFFSAVIAGVLAMTSFGGVMPNIIPDIGTSIEASAEIVKSGKCGENVTWELDGEGTLTISGSGDMYASRVYRNSSIIKKVIIENGVTSIGRYAFEGCTSLTSIIIPDSVTSIGNEAFYGTPFLGKLKSENGIKYAGKVALKADENITEAVIKEGTKSIAEYAFYGCKSLTSVTIPDSVTSIGSCAFYGCTSLTSSV